MATSGSTGVHTTGAIFRLRKTSLNGKHNRGIPESASMVLNMSRCRPLAFLRWRNAVTAFLCGHFSGFGNILRYPAMMHHQSPLPEGRPGMSDVTLLSGLSELSFDFTLLPSLLFFCLLTPIALSVFLLHLLAHSPAFFLRKFFNI